MNNPLQSIPARVRAVLYVAYGIIALAYLAVSAYYDKDPEWVAGVGRVVGALSVPFAGLAASNVPPAKAAVVTVTSEEARDERPPAVRG